MCFSQSLSLERTQTKPLSSPRVAVSARGSSISVPLQPGWAARNISVVSPAKTKGQIKAIGHDRRESGPGESPQVPFLETSRQLLGPLHLHKGTSLRYHLGLTLYVFPGVGS